MNTPTSLARRGSLALAVSALALLTACEKAEVKTYSIPKEEPAAPAAPATSGDRPMADAQPPMMAQGGGTPGMQALPGMAEQAQAFDAPAMTAPAGWQAQPLGAMRKGSWKAPGENGMVADVSVTAFPGDVGGLEANVNRWLRQVNLPQMSPSQIETDLETVTIDGLTGYVLRGVGNSPDAVLGLVLPRGNGTWFFKMSGPKSVVEAQDANFRAFIKTIDFQ